MVESSSITGQGKTPFTLTYAVVVASLVAAAACGDSGDTASTEFPRVPSSSEVLVWANGGYQLGYRRDFVYSGAGELVEIAFSQPDGGGGIVGWYRFLWEYDEQNQIALFERQEYDTTLSAWDPKQRGTYSYNGEGRVAEILFENYENNAWVASYRQIYIYNPSDGDRIERIERRSVTSDTTGDWDQLYEYDSGGALTSLSLTGLLRWEFERDATGRLSARTTFAWSGAWVEDERTTLEYDQGALSMRRVYEWSTNDWVESERFMPVLDSAGLIQSEEATFYSFNSATWLPWTEQTYMWTETRGPRDYFDHVVRQTPSFEAQMMLYDLGFSPR